jgi:hypothetical protein
MKLAAAIPAEAPLDAVHAEPQKKGNDNQRANQG